MKSRPSWEAFQVLQGVGLLASFLAFPHIYSRIFQNTTCLCHRYSLPPAVHWSSHAHLWLGLCSTLPFMWALFFFYSFSVSLDALFIFQYSPYRSLSLQKVFLTPPFPLPFPNALSSMVQVSLDSTAPKTTIRQHITTAS